MDFKNDFFNFKLSAFFNGDGHGRFFGCPVNIDFVVNLNESEPFVGVTFPDFIETLADCIFVKHLTFY